MQQPNIPQLGPMTNLVLRCSGCGRLHSRTEKMRTVDIRRMWQELVYQKDLVNNSDCNLCCDEPLEYYIGDFLAREVLFGKEKR